MVGPTIRTVLPSWLFQGKSACDNHAKAMAGMIERVKDQGDDVAPVWLVDVLPQERIRCMLNLFLLLDGLCAEQHLRWHHNFILDCAMRSPQSSQSPQRQDKFQQSVLRSH